MTESSVLYRKYRPQNFDQIVGQADVVTALSAAAESQSPAHAYLFAGGRGTGKTSLARIFARALGVDDADVYEMDAASHRGVDDVRELRAAVHTLPLSSKYKVYILDEAHMLTKEAFNALLKVLEEPPQHVLFILATTELDRIPETIRSRCQVFSFNIPSQATLADVVTDIAAREGITLDAGAADLVARAGDGSFRDTLGALQRVIQYAGTDGTVRLAEVTRVLGTVGFDLVQGFLTGVLEKKPEVFSLIESLSDGQAEDLVVTSLDYIRQALVLRYRGEESAEGLSSNQMDFVKALAASKVVTSALITELLDTHAALRRATIATVPLFLFVTRQFEKAG